jgi:ketosteroid isomerase-like protein
MTGADMTTADIAKEFTTALQTGKYEDAERLWSDDVVSLEAQDGPMKEARGRAAVHAKADWWFTNHDIHKFETAGPYVNGEQFTLRFAIDVTQKATGNRVQMDEVGLYTVRGGKIVEERFFY